MAVAVAAAVVTGCSASPSPETGAGGAGRGAAVAPSTLAPTEPRASGAATGAATDTAEGASRGSAGGYQNPDLGGTDSTPVSAATPVRVQIPAIGVDSGLESLSRDAAGSILPPVDFGSAGWYSQGVVPGRIGPAVIAGHIDSSVGPAVFFRLSSLTAGDVITVTLSDGTETRFAVDSSIQVAKADFPTGQVYGPTPTAQLRLVTCGGVFDDSWGHYLDNVVVFASLSPTP
ncbi:hypothetical protein B7R25_01775 [Subtercola boreus]|uniref:Class F sortase n=1 Tax=Subtercola boreus TaxID=120213 RepID=A0A3E0WGN6_9MICO|nr:hypothetical protein B7R24_01780 [Subtercola boreus]RFA24022.1 hypothetical protein B7R23_01780 [Subtercola boreus]RFA29721.1 hypothetical protein B7R25_01775 [Subtercola boreus]